MVMFEYQPLPDSSHIRLLKIPKSQDHYANENNKLPTFEIIDVPLGKVSSYMYTAISYVWGPPEPTYDINISTGTMSITRNLFTALPYLIRFKTYLWIDQICINQKDNDEKSSQVLLMGKIYQLASNTDIWLGEDDGTMRQIQYLHEIITELGAHMSFAPKTPDVLLARPTRVKLAGEATIEFFQLLLSKGENDYIGAALKVLARPWFRRAWVVQEFILSGSSYFQVGSSSIGGRVFQGIMEALSMAQLSTSVGFSNSGSLFRSVGYCALLNMINRMEEMQGTRQPELAFFFLNRMASTTLAADPRDKVYAFLSLISDARYRFNPNYNLELGQVCTETAKAFIEGSRTLDVLGLCRGVFRSSVDSPSWGED